MLQQFRDAYPSDAAFHHGRPLQTAEGRWFLDILQLFCKWKSGSIEKSLCGKTEAANHKCSSLKKKEQNNNKTTTQKQKTIYFSLEKSWKRRLAVVLILLNQLSVNVIHIQAMSAEQHPYSKTQWGRLKHHFNPDTEKGKHLWETNSTQSYNELWHFSARKTRVRLHWHFFAGISQL